MASAGEHLRLYGELRKVMLSRYFALGKTFRNDFVQEGAAPAVNREEFLAAGPEERQRLLWGRRAARDNPWLFGSQLITALATEARLELPGAEPLLDRTIRSCEMLFPFPAFAGLPVRWDPVTSDDWWQPREDGPPLARDFLVRSDGRDYLLDVRSRDPRHCPLITPAKGQRLMGGRLFARYEANRDTYRAYRVHEASPEEMIGATAAYIAVAEGTRVTALANVARNRLQQILTYLAEHAFLMVQPNGGLSFRGPGAGLPALEWPFRRAIERACSGLDLSTIATVSFQDGLASAGLWPLLKPPTDLMMAAFWTAAPILAGALAALQAGTITTLTGVPLPASVLLRMEGLASLVGGLSGLDPFFDFNPGQLGFAAGILAGAEAFDVDRESYQSEMALAALLTALQTWERYTAFVRFSIGRGPATPWFTGWVPFLGLITVGEADRGASDLYWEWLTARRARNVDQFTSADLPYVGYSVSCFASSVALLHRTPADWTEADNAAEESLLLSKLDQRYDELTADGGPWLLDDTEIRRALDYVVAVALSWRYRANREAAGRSVPTAGLPAQPTTATQFPAPAVPRAIVESPERLVPVEAIQGVVPPQFSAADEAELFLPSSPRRPRVPTFTLTFAGDNDVLFDDEFDVAPGREVATGAVLQWGDLLEIDADGLLDVGGVMVGPDGLDAPLAGLRYPLHAGIDAGTRPHALLARLNNYVDVSQTPRIRWLYPQETFVYLRLNQFAREGTGSFRVRVKVTGRRVPLSRYLEVGCITREPLPPIEERPPNFRPSRRIVGIGGTHRDQSRWRRMLQEAFEDQEAGTVYFIRAPHTVAAELRVTQSADGTFGVRTWPDALSPNNLSQAIRCE